MSDLNRSEAEARHQARLDQIESYNKSRESRQLLGVTVTVTVGIVELMECDYSHGIALVLDTQSQGNSRLIVVSCAFDEPPGIMRPLLLVEPEGIQLERDLETSVGEAAAFGASLPAK